MPRKRFPVIFAVALAATSAHATVEISAGPTKNINCTSGVCSPTAKHAVLNTTDLANMLATSDVKIVTGSSAASIKVSGPFAWASTHRLTLDAYYNVAFRAAVTVMGKGGLAIVTADGQSGGDFRFFSGGQVDFEDVGSNLTINGRSFALAASVPELVAAINESDYKGYFALARTTDASVDGSGNVKKPFSGAFEGLGHTITNLSLTGHSGGLFDCFGLFSTAQDAVIRDIKLSNVQVLYSGEGSAGALVGCNKLGSIIYSSAQGSLASAETGGGLVGENFSTISESFANVDVRGIYAGGLVGVDRAITKDCYAVGSVVGIDAGGLFGWTEGSSTDRSYATGAVSGMKDSSSIGGLIGYDAGGENSSSYWDLDTSGISDPAQGAGNIQNDPGITGLSDAQLKSGLPSGFDPAIWGQSPSINNGYPYLRANPPPK